MVDVGTTPISKTTVENRGFVAGTPVWTKTGLVPIEKLRIGDWVLSQPDTQSELVYRQVTNTFEYNDKEVYIIQHVEEGGDHLSNLVVTGNHPFWVKGIGWTTVESLADGCKLELQNGRAASVYGVLRVLDTTVKDVGWTWWSNEWTGPIIDLRNNSVNVGSEDVSRDDIPEILNETPTNFDDCKAIKRKVFNIEVDGLHTYYVGELGVWTHS